MGSVWRTHVRLPEAELAVIEPARGGSPSYRLEGPEIPGDANDQRGPLTVPADRWPTFVCCLFMSLFEQPGHPFAASSEAAIDTENVFQFAGKMARKLARKREEGRGGWHDAEECSPGHLAQLLLDHLGKGDPVDVANFAMMLGQRPDSAGVLAKHFEAWLKAQVKSSTEFAEMSATANFHSSRADEERDKRIKSEVRLEQQLKAAQKEVETAQQAQRAAEERATRLERNLARALGYIDRVNEGRAQPAPQLTTLGPELEAAVEPGRGIDPYWRG